MRAVAAGQPLGEVLTKRQKWLLVVSLMLAMFIGAVDQTVVSTATPKILGDLGGYNLLSWLFTSYMLSSTVVVPLVGKLSDIFGRKSFVLGGIIIFLISSIACGAAPNMMTLIAFRVVQGLGGGMIFASVFASIGDIFPPAERSKFMGLFTGTFALASILGPLVGGTLTDNLGWRWVFFINVPIAAIALPAIWWNLPSRHGVVRPKIDWAGAALLSIASVAALLAFEWAGREYAWGSVQIIGLLALTFGSVALFILQESRHPEPIIPLHLFKNRVFLVANLMVLIMGAGMFGALQYLGIFIQTAKGASATASGVIATPQSFGMLAASVLGGQLIARTGRYRYQTMFGSMVVLGAMLFLRTIQVDSPNWHISAIMVALGVGFGLSMPTVSLAVQNAVPYQYLGVASSSNQFFRQIGSVFGIAIFAVVLQHSYDASYNSSVSAETRAAFGPELNAEFRDPTLALSPAFAVVAAKVTALPNGEALLAEATSGQKEAVASGVRDIFTGAAIVAALAILLAFFLKEVPLRKDFKQAATAEAARIPSAGEGTPTPEAAPGR